MTDRTKMIFIISNEDLIQQFSLRNSTNTQIIDLEDDHINTELSEIKSNNQQVDKRLLHSPQSKSNKLLRKSIEMICAICTDRAIGFNYDALSCGSCKAFFRRNAHQNMEKLRCLGGEGQCSIDHLTRRKCTKCRLKRCFEVGMKKEFLMTDEEKQKRQKRLEEHRKISTTQSTQPSSIPHSPLAEEEIDRFLSDLDHSSLQILSMKEWRIIDKFRSLFVSQFQNDGSQQPFMNVNDRISALISWAYVANQNALRFIDFFRQIDQFEQLNNDDRFSLIKSNTFPRYPILKSFHFNRTTNNCCSNGNDQEINKSNQFYQLCFGVDGLRDSFQSLVRSLVELTEQDPIILSLSITILMFYEGLSINDDRLSLKDGLNVNRIQSYYVQILWKYLLSKWNEDKTWKYFIRFLPVLFRIESTGKHLSEYVRGQISNTNAVEQVSPLLQSLLHIS